MEKLAKTRIEADPDKKSYGFCVPREKIHLERACVRVCACAYVRVWMRVREREKAISSLVLEDH